MAIALPATPPDKMRTDSDSHLTQRIEEASLNAWPALQQIFLDGWVLRFARGFTKRSNSIVPLYATSWAQDIQTQPEEVQLRLAARIRYCENLYAREQLQTVFRITSFDMTSHTTDVNAQFNSAKELLDQTLEERGYVRQDTSLVLSKPITQARSVAGFRLLPLDQWLSAYSHLTGLPEPAQSLHGLILKSISGDCAFAVLENSSGVIACGMAVVEQELVGLFDIYTDVAHRGQGHGTNLIDGLCNWAVQAHAQRVYLQVVADNQAALTLYQQLGFGEVYRYWYRTGP
ncbi:MAG: GNAT family N-acetyltransferase [Pseudomonadaceae bacterium]|nr:GNAT family N-acetyltransferase [Pseudomonadaceae bacterium]